MSLSSEDRAIARAALEAFGGEPTVCLYWDDNEQSSIHLLLCKDRPYEGVSSYSTIGLSGYSIDQPAPDGTPLRVEIVGACGSRYECFRNVLASCAFNIINTKYTCYPGAIYPNVVTPYLPDSAMKHILFEPPFLWEGKLPTLSLPDRKVAWLLAVPISEAELDYAKRHGIDALDTVFEEQQIDIFNLERKSVV